LSDFEEDYDEQELIGRARQSYRRYCKKNGLEYSGPDNSSTVVEDEKYHNFSLSSWVVLRNDNRLLAVYEYDISTDELSIHSAEPCRPKVKVTI